MKLFFQLYVFVFFVEFFVVRICENLELKRYDID